MAAFQVTTEVSSKEVFARLKLNSKQWYDTSNTRIAEAVHKVNEDWPGADRIRRD